MARLLNRLSARSVDTLKKPGLHADGGGLYLRIDEAGAKRWTFVYRWRGKRKEMGLGPVRTIRLADARVSAEAARKQVQDGIDPVEARKATRAISAGLTFGALADEVVESLKPGWKNPKHAAQWEMTLREYVHFRDKPVALVTTDDVEGALRPIWLTIPDTASRLRGRIERVLDVAKARGLFQGENPARWRGHLSVILPKQPKLVRGHHAAMPYADLPAFMVELRKRHSMGARCLEFTILTVARTTEATDAKPVELGKDRMVWTVPAERMKNGKEHRVPLEEKASTLVSDLLEVGGRRATYVFPGLTKGKPISSATMDAVLVRMEQPYTVHGFRSSFSDWAHEKTSFPHELIEMCLAHTVASATSKAYWRGDALDQRREIMRAWQDYLGG